MDLLKQKNESEKLKQVDTWETFTVRFEVSFLLDHNQASLRINGDHAELGDWKKAGPIVMSVKDDKKTFWHEISFV